jgi:hypothetical protein
MRRILDWPPRPRPPIHPHYRRSLAQLQIASRLRIVAVLAQRLKIRCVVLAATTQGHDVIDLLGTGKKTLALAGHTQRVGAQPLGASGDASASAQALN